MDLNHHSQQLHQLGQHPHGQQSLPQFQQQQQQQQQLNSPAPQDVLAEARKNLQVLIDSGLSKDLLHQWVDDDSLSLQLSFPGQSLAPSASPTTSAVSTPIPSPLLPQPDHLSSPPQQQPHSQASSLGPPIQAPPPPPPQCAPPPIPTIGHTSPVPSVSASSTTTASPTPGSSSATLSGSTAAPSPVNGAPPTITIIKEEPSFAEDVSRAWAAVIPPATSPNQMTAPSTPVPQLSPSHDRPISIAANGDPSLYIPSSIQFFNHRPRISVSSTSSGSSGHASLWSVNSAQSAMSWQSASSARSQALPPVPQMSPAGAPLISTSHAATLSAANKQNIYWCTSCETSFKRKYDWKRHEDEFHERWRKYPCPEPGCNRSFWGSNSFNQHHKQCHGCKTCPHAEKVVKFLRKRKYWACGFCSALHPARERHVEHVARHFESGLTKGDWMHSRVVYGLLHQPLIHGAWDALVASKHAEGRRPQFSWHPSKTGRAQGFLEKENPGQLQDLLEFFSGDEGEAQWIVTVAYDLSDIVYNNNSNPAQPQQMQPHSMAPPTSYPQQQQQDARISFAPLPSQAPPQQMMTSPVPGAPSSFHQSPFRNSGFVPSQGFQQPPPSTQAHLDKRELPPVPRQNMSDSLMDFEYSTTPVIFEDWESIASSTMLDTSSHQQSQQQSNHGGQADWGMSQFYTDPRVTS